MSTLKSELSLTTIVSNGLKGCPVAALDWALLHGLSVTGWCPHKSSKSPDRYELKEIDTQKYQSSLHANIRESDATIVFSMNHRPTSFVERVIDVATNEVKPVLHFRPGVHTKWLTSFLVRNNVRTVHIVGAQESLEPGIGDFVTSSLEQALCAESVDLAMAS